MLSTSASFESTDSIFSDRVTGAAVLMIAALANFLFASGCSNSDNVQSPASTTAADQAVADQLKAVSVQLEELRDRLTSRPPFFIALGKEIPVKLPETLTGKLEDLEAQVAAESRWPKSADEEAPVSRGHQADPRPDSTLGRRGPSAPLERDPVGD